MDAFEMMAAPAPEPSSLELRAGLIELVQELAWALTESKRSKMLPALIDAAERDAGVAALQARHTRLRRAPMMRVINAAQDRGEISKNIDLELALDQLSGPLFYRRLITHSPIDSDFIEKLVDSLIVEWQHSG